MTAASPTPAAASPEARRPRIVYFYLAVIVATWAGNWPLMKLALGDAPPLAFVLLRLAGSLVLIAAALKGRGRRLLPQPGERLGLLWVGQLQVAVFLICSIIGLAIVPPGRAIVLAYTMPLWAIPIALWLWHEPLARLQFVGAGLGFAGLLLFMNPRLVDWSNPRSLAGNGLLLLAALAWALGSCLYRRRLWRSSVWAQTFWQLAVSIVVVAAVAAAVPGALGQPIRWSLGLVAILAYNWVVTTALGYFLWSKVLTMMPAAVAGQVLALTPIGGFLLSMAMFGGAVDGETFASIALIVAGIVLTLRR